MIKLSGRAIRGLDEFMLRTGHLKVVCNVAAEAGGTRHRVERQAKEVFTSFAEVPPSQVTQVAEYLACKHLCEIEGEESKAEKVRYRYQDLIITQSGPSQNIRSRGGNPISVWWQDLCLSDRRSRSMVGSVTATGKADSKTGLSHVFDWAESVGLLSTSGQPTPIARLLAKLEGKTRGLEWLENPYVIGLDKILLGYVLIACDLDVFSRFIVRLAGASFPLKKRPAAYLFAATVTDIVNEADRAAYLGPRPRYHIDELMRDLKKSARRNRGELGDTSTSWHRAASRLETYVDLGILAKEHGSESHKYEYVYYGTPLLAEIAHSIEDGSDPDDWLEDKLVAAVTGNATVDAPLTIELLESLLPPVLRAMRVASTAVPIEAIAIGIAQLAAAGGVFLSLRAARRTVEELAKKCPDVARLARGTHGQRAEFITIDPRRYSQ